MATSESDLKEQLADLDWGTTLAPAVQEEVQVTPEPAPVPVGVTEMPEMAGAPIPTSDSLDIDVGVAGVTTPPARGRRGGRRAAVRPAPVAAEVGASEQEAAAAGKRRGRNTRPDVLIQAGESPAVMALFDAMWRDVGAKLARGIGRPKASRQDAAIGWYAMLLAMRERDAKK